jgi:hypothetical protein
MLLQAHPGTWVGTTNDTWNPIRKFYAKIQFKFAGRLKSPIAGEERCRRGRVGPVDDKVARKSVSCGIEGTPPPS